MSETFNKESAARCGSREEQTIPYSSQWELAWLERWSAIATTWIESIDKTRSGSGEERLTRRTWEVAEAYLSPSLPLFGLTDWFHFKSNRDKRKTRVSELESKKWKLFVERRRRYIRTFVKVRSLWKSEPQLPPWVPIDLPTYSLPTFWRGPSTDSSWRRTSAAAAAFTLPPPQSATPPAPLPPQEDVMSFSSSNTKTSLRRLIQRSPSQSRSPSATTKTTTK